MTYYYNRDAKCEHCKAKFTERWRRSNRKYCNNACRQAAWRTRKAVARGKRNKTTAKKSTSRKRR